MPTQPGPTVNQPWRNILPAAAPGASQGTPYSFWVKEGDTTKLAVIFGGGGACWTGENCALHCQAHYRPFAGLELDPTNLAGIFDTDNPENPLADYTLVFLPTANGDVFLGDATQVYDTPAMNGHPEGKLTILHKGFRQRHACPGLDVQDLPAAGHGRGHGMERRRGRLAPLHAHCRPAISATPWLPTSPMAVAPIT